MAISGSAITNANAGTITAGTSTGDQSFTGVGFQPDFVMFLSGLTESLDTNTPDMFFNTGFMDSAGEQAAVSLTTPCRTCCPDSETLIPCQLPGWRRFLVQSPAALQWLFRRKKAGIASAGWLLSHSLDLSRTEY